MGVFNFHLNKQDNLTSESYYEMEPLSEKELLAEEKALEEAENQSKSETNNAFNETENYKRFAQAYQPIAPPKDYEYTPANNQNKNIESSNNNTSQPEINDDVLTSFDNVNSVLRKQQSNISEQSVNKKSSVHYSLLNRTHKSLPIPVYLCESGGKIVINITVNASGKVTHTSINEAASVNNACLKDHAMEYAKKARFNNDASKKVQLGSITFYFESKH